MRRNHGAIALTVIILLVGAFLRTHQLDVPSMWYDEGVSVGHSGRTLLEMIPMLQNNVHVPAYFASLALWEDVTGDSVFAMRYYSVLWSVAGLAFAFALGKRLYGDVAGVAAAGFIALNTFNIHYAQEIRMYAMLATLATASMWLFVGFVGAFRRNEDVFLPALGFASVNALGMYTHFSYALLMVAQGVMAVLWLGALLVGNIRLVQPVIRPTTRLIRPGFEPIYTVGTTLRALIVYTVANLLTVAAFYPWIEVALRQTGSVPNYAVAQDFGAFVRLLQGWFAFGATFEGNLHGMGIVVYFFVLFGLVFLPYRPRGEWWRMLLPIVWVGVSVGLYTYFELWERYLRFLLPAQMAFALLMGRGVWVLWHIRTRERRAPWRYLPRAVTLFAVLAFWYTLGMGVLALYDGSPYPLKRDDFKGLAQTIQAQAGARDAVIVASQGVREVFGYYYKGLAPIFPLPASGDLESNVRAIIGNYERVYAVYYGEREHDPDGVIERTLNTEAFPIDGNWWREGDVRFYRYATPTVRVDAQAIGVTFGGSITLISAEQYQDGDLLTLALRWQSTQALPTRYKVFVQLLNADGTLALGRDSEPVGGVRPTPTWGAGETVLDRHALDLSGLPSGTYTLIVGWYDANDARVRLPLADGATALVLGQVVR